MTRAEMRKRQTKARDRRPNPPAARGDGERHRIEMESRRAKSRKSKSCPSWSELSHGSGGTHQATPGAPPPERLLLGRRWVVNWRPSGKSHAKRPVLWGVPQPIRTAIALEKGKCSGGVMWVNRTSSSQIWQEMAGGVVKVACQERLELSSFCILLMSRP